MFEPEFAYDALGRRIKRFTNHDSQTTYYYYNNNWQILCEYNASDVFQRLFAYGNYIDEVLIMSTGYAPPLAKFYIHDHLYSPAALLLFNGIVVERYEYDAYGACQILDPNFASDPDQKSDFANPYLFTGRRVDILDSGSLKIQYNRNRYYDYYTGRWLSHDPIGYIDSINLYEYVKSNPLAYVDPLGLAGGDIELVSLGLYKGLGGSMNVALSRTAKDCCCKGDKIIGGDVTIKVDVDAHAGIGVGIEAKVGEVGVRAVWRGPGLTGHRTFAFRNDKCGSGLSGKLCERVGTDFATGGNLSFGIGVMRVSISGDIEGDFYLEFCAEANCDKITVTLDGCCDLGLDWKAHWTVLSVVVKEKSGNVPEGGCKRLVTKEYQINLGRRVCKPEIIACSKY